VSTHDIGLKARRRLPWVVILGAGAVLGSGAALQWREIAIRWRVAELARQPAESELPVDFVVAGPGTTARDALMRHLRTPAGKERLLRSYLSVFERSRTPISQCLDHVGLGGKTALILFWMGGTLRAKAATDSEWMEHLRSIQDYPSIYRRRGYMPLRRGMCSSIRNSGLGSSTLDMSFYTRLQELVVEVGYDEHPIPDRVGARFSVVSCKGAEKPCERHFLWDFQWGPYAALLESDPHRLDPAP